MNDHLISRSRFLDALVLDADNKTDLIQVHQALEKAVISPDEVRGVGEWLIEEQEVGGINGERQVILIPYCSNCGTPNEWNTNYCPNCGARMKGADA